MRFGPFQVSGLKLSTVTDLGKPVLIAVDTGDKLTPQKAGADSTPYLFTNELPTARAFYFSFQGNTPRGVTVMPDLPANQLAVDDSLAFSNVDAAGLTKVVVPATDYPEFYRTLRRNFRIHHDSLHFRNYPVRHPHQGGRALGLHRGLLVGAEETDSRPPFDPRTANSSSPCRRTQR